MSGAPTSEQLVERVLNGIGGTKKSLARAALATLQSRIEDLKATIEQREVGYRGQLERAERAEAELAEQIAITASWQNRTIKAEAEVLSLREALRGIVDKYENATADLDAFEDHGGHVGIARHDAAVLQGLGTCADIARAALFEEPQ